MARFHHRTYDKNRAYYDRIDDALEGQDAVRANAVTYLRNMPGMSKDSFSAYSRGGSYYPTAERTLRGMTGLALRNAPRIDLPNRLEPMRASATYRVYRHKGTSGPIGLVADRGASRSREFWAVGIRRARQTGFETPLSLFVRQTNL